MGNTPEMKAEILRKRPEIRAVGESFLADGGSFLADGKRRRRPDASAAVAGYVRVSHLEFPVDRRDPADRQAWVEGLRHLRRAELASDAARDGQVITAWYDDLGVSGLGEARARRADFERLRADASRGRIRAVYARDLSRLFRDLLQQELWFAEMEACGVVIHAQDLPFTPDAATGRLLRQQLGAMHEFQARRQGAIIQAILRERVAAGTLAGMGHSYWGLRFNHVTKAFAFDPATADHACLVFETFVAEGGAAAAARTLNALVEEGHPRATLTPRGRPWTDNLVLLRVRNAVYRRRVAFAGVVRDVPALIPEVVPPALVAQADALLAARNPGPAPPRQTYARHVYGGLLRCGVCGAPVYSTRSGSRPRPTATGGSVSADGADPVSAGRTSPDRRPVTWSCSAANVDTGGGHGGMVSQERLDALVGRALAQAFPAGLSLPLAFRAGHTLPSPSPPKSPLNIAELTPGVAPPAEDGRRHERASVAAPHQARQDAAPLDPTPLLARTAARRQRALDLYATGLLTDADALRRHLEALDAQETGLRIGIAGATREPGESPIPTDAEARQREEQARQREAAFRQMGAEFRQLWGTPDATMSVGGPPRDAEKRALLKSAGVAVCLEVHPRAGQAQVTRGAQGGLARVRVDLAALGLVGPRALEAAEIEAERAAADGGEDTDDEHARATDVEY